MITSRAHAGQLPFRETVSIGKTHTHSFLSSCTIMVKKPPKFFSRAASRATRFRTSTRGVVGVQAEAPTPEYLQTRRAQHCVTPPPPPPDPPARRRSQVRLSFRSRVRIVRKNIHIVTYNIISVGWEVVTIAYFFLGGLLRFIAE